MKYKYSKSSYKVIFTVLLSLIYLILVFFNPETAKNAINNALQNWFYNIMPVLFPFSMAFSIIIGSGVIRLLNFGRHPKTGFYFVILSISSLIAGYPCSARLISTMKRNGDLNETQADFLFCCTSLPGIMYLYGTVCSIYLSCPNEAIYMLISTAASAIIMYAFRKKSTGFQTISKKFPSEFNLSETICSSIASASSSMLNIAASMAVFGSFCSLLYEMNILENNFASCVICGLIDMTCGITKLALIEINDIYRNAAALFFVNFGGISILLQSISAYTNCKSETTKSLFLNKGLQAFTASVIYLCIKYTKNNCYILLLVFVITAALQKDRSSALPQQ